MKIIANILVLAVMSYGTFINIKICHSAITHTGGENFASLGLFVICVPIIMVQTLVLHLVVVQARKESWKPFYLAMLIAFTVAYFLSIGSTVYGFKMTW